MINKTRLVGILNITPDSFSDGGLYFDSDSIFEKVRSLIKEGADIIDVGAQSTRPNAKILSKKQEWERLSPHLLQLIDICHAYDVRVSIDSYHPEVVIKALEAGADIVNDVNGLQDPAMIKLVAKNDCKVIMMHSLTVPADKKILVNEDLDIIQVLLEFASNQIKHLISLKIDPSRLIFDPGIGFNKNAKQSWEIINRIEELKQLNLPLYIGHSRKSFLGTPPDKDLETLKISKELINKNIDYIRLHNIALLKSNRPC